MSQSAPAASSPVTSVKSPEHSEVMTEEGFRELDVKEFLKLPSKEELER